MKIKKGDTVKIIKGKDKGKTGKTLRVDFEVGKVMVEGLNLYKKHARPKKQGEKGEIVLVARPMAISNVMIVCSSCGRAVRVGYRFDGEKKVRFCKKCQAAI